MTDDDLYVNGGESFDTGVSYYDKPTEQVEAEAQAASKKAASYPVLGDVADWFQAQIENCPDINNLQFDMLTINGVQVDRKTSIEAQALAYKLLQDLMIEKFQEFQEFVNER